MSELISKRRLEEALICGLCRSEKTDDYKNGLQDALRVAEAIEPVNAVELPCKIGDTVYEVIEECGAKGSFDCAYNGGHGYSRCRGRFAGKCEAYIQETHFVLSDFGYVGERIFLTREEAEKALEDLKNENK